MMLVNNLMMFASSHFSHWILERAPMSHSLRILVNTYNFEIDANLTHALVALLSKRKKKQREKDFHVKSSISWAVVTLHL